jgi:hypothetical protein
MNGPSYDLWDDCPVGEIQVDPSVGIYGYDDFTQCAYNAAPASLRVGRYDVYGDTGVTIGPSGLQGGGLKIAANDADNDEASIQVGGGGILLSSTASVARKAWFEASVRKEAITNEGLGFFLGLATPASAAADVLVNDTAALAASKSYIGYHVLNASASALDFIYGKSTSTVVTWGTAVASMVAATFIKVGFKFDPDAIKKVRLYINGAEYLTDYIDATDLAHATSLFPKDDVMSPIYATKVGTATEAVNYLRWWRWAQLAV